MLGRDEEIVLQQIAGEEQPVPLVVSELLGEMFDFVGATLDLALTIAKLLGLGAEFAPQVALRLVHVWVGLALMHGQRFERMPRTAFGDLARLLDGAFQLAA